MTRRSIASKKHSADASTVHHQTTNLSHMTTESCTPRSSATIQQLEGSPFLCMNNLQDGGRSSWQNLFRLKLRFAVSEGLSEVHPQICPRFGGRAGIAPTVGGNDSDLSDIGAGDGVETGEFARPWPALAGADDAHHGFLWSGLLHFAARAVKSRCSHENWNALNSRTPSSLEGAPMGSGARRSQYQEPGELRLPLLAQAGAGRCA